MQLTLVAVAVALIRIAVGQPGATSRPLSEVIAIALGAAMFLTLALWMGIRTIRGPQPPSLD